MKKYVLILAIMCSSLLSFAADWVYCEVEGQGDVKTIQVWFQPSHDCYSSVYVSVHHMNNGDVNVSFSGWGELNFGAYDCCPLV